MESMSEVKAELSTLFKQLGYQTHVANFTRFDFNLQGQFSHSGGRCEITSANAKRLEIALVSNDKLTFNQSLQDSARPDPENERRWVVTKRFSKREGVAEQIIEWLATATTEHSHLLELLRPSEPLPAPYKFRAGAYVQGAGGHTYPGMLEKVKVMDVVATIGRAVTGTPYDPKLHPYFLIQVEMRSSPKSGESGTQFHAITDGDIWYPVMEYFQDGHAYHRVFFDGNAIRRLSNMNQNDKNLVAAAAIHYVEANFSDHNQDNQEERT